MENDPRRPPSYQAILEAAEKIFGERGYRKTTLKDIAAAAKVSRPLVYRHLEDKRGLFARVAGRVLTEWNEVLAAEAARATPGTAHTFRLVLAACLHFARSRSVLRGIPLRDAGLVRFLVGDVLDEERALLPKLIRQILGTQRTARPPLRHPGQADFLLGPTAGRGLRAGHRRIG